MSEQSDAITEARAEIASEPEIFTRRCSLIPQIKGSDGFHGHKLVDDTANTVTGIPVTVKFMSGGYQVDDGSGSIVVKTHKLKFPVTAQTMAITKSHKIVVAAADLTPEMVFEHPVGELGDTDVFLFMGASFAEGYRQPAMT